MGDGSSCPSPKMVCFFLQYVNYSTNIRNGDTSRPSPCHTTYKWHYMSRKTTQRDTTSERGWITWRGGLSPSFHVEISSEEPFRWEEGNCLFSTSKFPIRAIFTWGGGLILPGHVESHFFWCGVETPFRDEGGSSPRYKLCITWTSNVSVKLSRDFPSGSVAWLQIGARETIAYTRKPTSTRCLRFTRADLCRRTYMYNYFHKKVFGVWNKTTPREDWSERKQIFQIPLFWHRLRADNSISFRNFFSRIFFKSD